MSVLILVNRTGDADQAAARKLARLLGRPPLALGRGAQKRLGDPLVGRVLSRVGVAHRAATRSAPDRFRETLIVPRWWFGERTSPRTAQVPSLDLSPDRPRLGVVTLVLVAAGRSRVSASSRGCCGGFPRAGLPGGADLAAWPPAPERPRAVGGGRGRSCP